MLDTIIYKNILFLQNYGVKIDNDDDRAIYKYGLQILYCYIIDLVVVFSLAYLFGKLYETVITVFLFGLLQVFGGGYHAKSPLKCLLIIIAGATVSNIFVLLISDMVGLTVLLSIITSIVILILTPLSSKKHPVSRKIKQRSKLIIRAVIALLFIGIMILYYFNRNVEITVVSVTLTLYFISLVFAKYKDF